MKLIIQIPCYNEEETLSETVAALPHSLPGIDRIETLVIDDGSEDRTAEVARQAGVDHVVQLRVHRGLARAFMAGVEACLQRGADVILNTDADNQYDARDVSRLVEPILRSEADIVIGARPIAEIAHFSRLKRWFQRLGSHVVRTLSATRVHDAPSGFRAFNRTAAIRLNVFNRYTYTLETIIQAGLSNLRVLDVPVRVNPPTRPSRLIRSTGQYLRRGASAIIGAYLIYRPTSLFNLLAALFFIPGLVLALRYLYFMVIGEGTGHVQSVILAGVLLVCAVFMAVMGVIAYLLAINRRLLEELRSTQRQGAPPTADG